MEEQKELCPSNNLALAIITTVLCCVPLGVVAIVKAASVERLWNAGQKEEALQAAATAKKLSIWGIVVGAVVSVLYLILAVVAELA